MGLGNVLITKQGEELRRRVCKRWMTLKIFQKYNGFHKKHSHKIKMINSKAYCLLMKISTKIV